MARARNQAGRKLVTRLFARNRRRGPRVDRSRWALAAWRGSRVLVPVVMAALAWPAVRERVRTHAYFALAEVTVERRGHLSEDTIRRHAALRPGMPIWDVDTAAIEARLEALPWVRAADVRRHLPDRVAIRVREYRPLAIVRVEKAERPLYYVAADGRIFAPVEDTDGRDLPYVSGLARTDVEEADGGGREIVRDALAALDAAARHGAALGAVSEVHVDRQRGVTVMPTRPAVPIHLGRGAFAEKLARAAEILPQWVGRETEMRGVSCEFADQVIVRLRGRAGGVGA
jgi:cell division protein FtsQ